MLGPRNRAPLGLKTTNARAKAFQTPAAPGTDNALDKTTQKSGTARKPKPRVNHAEMSKVEVLGQPDETDETEIEYMPPKPEGEPSRDHVHTSLFADINQLYPITPKIGRTMWTTHDSKAVD